MSGIKVIVLDAAGLQERQHHRLAGKPLALEQLGGDCLGQRHRRVARPGLQRPQGGPVRPEVDRLQQREKHLTPGYRSKVKIVGLRRVVHINLCPPGVRRCPRMYARVPESP
jgi:hypothetical protein